MGQVCEEQLDVPFVSDEAMIRSERVIRPGYGPAKLFPRRAVWPRSIFGGGGGILRGARESGGVHILATILAGIYTQNGE